MFSRQIRSLQRYINLFFLFLSDSVMHRYTTVDQRTNIIQKNKSQRKPKREKNNSEKFTKNVVIMCRIQYIFLHTKCKTLSEQFRSELIIVGSETKPSSRAIYCTIANIIINCNVRRYIQVRLRCKYILYIVPQQLHLGITRIKRDNE